MNDIADPTDKVWLERTRMLLDASTRDLNAATLSRLNRARQAALAQRHPRRLRPWFLSAGLASACALLLAIAVMHPQPSGSGNTLPTVAATAKPADAFSNDDMNIVSSDDSLELYQDLEFYAWLDAQDQGNSG